jgi:hypothetical protein
MRTSPTKADFPPAEESTTRLNIYTQQLAEKILLGADKKMTTPLIIMSDGDGCVL